MSTTAVLKDSKGEDIVLTDLEKKKGLTKEEIVKLIKAVSESTIKDVVKKVEGIPDEELGPMNYSIYDFIGFDPMTIIAVIKIIADHYNDPEKVMLSDVRFCIAACLYMGNIQAKAMSKRSAEGRAKLSYLATKYGITMGTTQSGQPAEVLTFPRVAASFPILAIKMADKISPKSVNLEFKSALVPGCMRLTPFASLCPPTMKEGVRMMLLEACNAHGSDMAIAYEKGRLKKAKKAVKYDVLSMANDQWAFIEVASSSPVPDDASRKALLSSLKLPTYYAAIHDVVQNYRAIVTKKEVKDIDMISRDDFERELTEFISA